jgi:hypothetical protein
MNVDGAVVERLIHSELGRIYLGLKSQGQV